MGFSLTYAIAWGVFYPSPLISSVLGSFALALFFTWAVLEPLSALADVLAGLYAWPMAAGFLAWMPGVGARLAGRHVVADAGASGRALSGRLSLLTIPRAAAYAAGLHPVTALLLHVPPAELACAVGGTAAAAAPNAGGSRVSGGAGGGKAGAPKRQLVLGGRAGGGGGEGSSDAAAAEDGAALAPRGAGVTGGEAELRAQLVLRRYTLLQLTAALTAARQREAEDLTRRRWAGAASSMNGGGGGGGAPWARWAAEHGATAAAGPGDEAARRRAVSALGLMASRRTISVQRVA
jgi:hypothetical protein